MPTSSTNIQPPRPHCAGKDCEREVIPFVFLVSDDVLGYSMKRPICEHHKKMIEDLTIEEQSGAGYEIVYEPADPEKRLWAKYARMVGRQPPVGFGDVLKILMSPGLIDDLDVLIKQRREEDASVRSGT